MAEGRDFVLARLAVARQHLESSIEAVDGCISMFIFPSEDKNGKDRKEALDIASDTAGEASRAIESAEAMFETLDKEELSEEEVDDDDGEEGVEAGDDDGSS